VTDGPDTIGSDTKGPDAIGEELAGWGKVALLETRGRVSGLVVHTAVGFTEATDGALLVAAGTDDADWALNVRANAQLTATIAGETRDYVAEELTGAERSAVITSLILKYGTPAERLGRGPAFRLVPVARGG
jgi:deazaflavin-dependent oxidoreductase (nitroreductase family)